MKTPRGTARKNRRDQCNHYDISWDGKTAKRVSRTDALEAETSRVFAQSIESAYQKAGIQLPK